MNFRVPCPHCNATGRMETDYRQMFVSGPKIDGTTYWDDRTPHQRNPWSVTTMGDKAYWNMIKKDLQHTQTRGI